MPPVPQHGVDAPVQPLGVDDEIRVARRVKASSPSRKDSQDSQAAVSRLETVSTQTAPVRCGLRAKGGCGSCDARRPQGTAGGACRRSNSGRKSAFRFLFALLRRCACKVV
jgi:hypothetical protein